MNRRILLAILLEDPILILYVHGNQKILATSKSYTNHEIKRITGIIKFDDECVSGHSISGTFQFR